jgi:cytosine/adenosine deaminase-related metal-dependent hydrolase
MGEILRRATVVELDPATVEVTDLRVDGDRITARGPNLPAQAGDLETDLSHKLVMPGLVCTHSHLAFTLGRGSPVTAGARLPAEPLDKMFWRLDRALDLPMIELSSAVGALEALYAGTTTVFDHHSSPTCIDGSLGAVQRGLEAVGLRGVLCYAVSDRLGPEGAQAGLRENERYLKAANGRFRGMVGAYASFNLDDETLRAAGDLAKRHSVGVHMHAAESLADEHDCQERFHQPLSQRLVESGAGGALSIVAHGTLFAWEDLAALLQLGTWMCHLPRANMLSGHGYAPAARFGPRAVLGTEHLAADMFAEVAAAAFRSADSGAPLDSLKLLSAGHKLASQLFGRPLGPMREGGQADLLVLDYQPRVPLTAQNLAHHMVTAINSRDVEAVMVDGCWRLWARQPLKTEPVALAAKAREVASTLFETMAQL